MALTGEIVPIVLIPRFSTFAGAGTAYPGIAIDVTDYDSGTVRAWRGPILGTSSPGLSLVIEHSSDGLNWSQLVAPSLASVTTVEVTLTLTRRFLRITATLSGTNPAVTLWCSGQLRKRVA